jgi:hypothetical protein
MRSKTGEVFNAAHLIPLETTKDAKRSLFFFEQRQTRGHIGLRNVLQWNTAKIDDSDSNRMRCQIRQMHDTPTRPCVNHGIRHRNIFKCQTRLQIFAVVIARDILQNAAECRPLRAHVSQRHVDDFALRILHSSHQLSPTRSYPFNIRDLGISM